MTHIIARAEVDKRKGTSENAIPQAFSAYYQRQERKMKDDWPILCVLAELGAVHESIAVSTTVLARRLGISQQTASRKLIVLERQGLVNRLTSPIGSEVRLTDKGTGELQRVYETLREAFEDKRQKTLVFNGRIFTGLGEGSYYVDRTAYKDSLEKALGFQPFPGTLNLRISPAQIARKKELEAHSGILIKGFQMGGRSFGDVKCFRASISGIEGAVVLIGRTHHDSSVVEFIAPVNLRDALKLKDGCKAEIIIQLDGKK